MSSSARCRSRRSASARSRSCSVAWPADGFFPLGRVSLQLLQPDIGLAGAIRDGPLLLLHGPACVAFEANQIVLKLESVAIQCDAFV